MMKSINEINDKMVKTKEWKKKNMKKPIEQREFPKVKSEIVSKYTI